MMNEKKRFQRRVFRSFFLSSILFTSFISPAFPFDHSPWAALLRAHVENGFADYAGFLKDKPALDDYLKRVGDLSVNEFADYSREDRMALWINAYNASVIRRILEFYPIDSIQRIPDFWNMKTVQVAGMRLSLSEIRDKVFRAGFRDERATLALVSGTKSSGPLRNEAYEGPQLLDQLRDQMNFFLSDERFNRIQAKKKKLFLSPLFQELRADFILGYGSSETDSRFSPEELAILSFIRIHLSDPKVKEWITNREYKLRYLPVNGSLNQSVKEKDKGKT